MNVPCSKDGFSAVKRGFLWAMVIWVIRVIKEFEGIKSYWVWVEPPVVLAMCSYSKVSNPIGNMPMESIDLFIFSVSVMCIDICIYIYIYIHISYRVSDWCF